MAFVPVAIGLSSFVAGYVTYQYMTASEDPIEESLTKDKKTEYEKKKLPSSITDELKQFDKGRLVKVDIDSIKPYRTHIVVEDIREQIANRRLSISSKKKSDQ